jgi:hypothetical protein
MYRWKEEVDKNPLGGPFEENIWHRLSSMQPL